MTDAAPSMLQSRIEPGASLLIDTSVVIAYLAGTEDISPLAVDLFDGLVATGRNPATLSAVTVAEILVRPFDRGSAALANIEGFLRHFGDLRLLPTDYHVAREGARLRALTGLPMPDALIVASAVVGGCDVVITNDRSWPTTVGPLLPELGFLVLADVLLDGGDESSQLAGSLRDKVDRAPVDESWEVLRDAAWRTPDPDRAP